MNGNGVSNGAARGAVKFFKSAPGILTVLVAVFAAGGATTFALSEQKGLPPRVAQNEADIDSVGSRTVVNRTSIDSIGRLLEWVVCTTIPPQRPDVLSALEVSCARYMSAGIFLDAPGGSVRSAEIAVPE